MAQSQPQYIIAFNEHPVHQNLKQLKQQVVDLPDDLLNEAQAHDPQASLARLEPVLDYVGALLASADTALVTPQMLEGLSPPVQQIASALTPLVDNREFEQQVPNVQAGVDGLLHAAMQIAGAIGVWAKSDQKKAAAQLGEAATAKTSQLQNQASDLQGQLNQLREEAMQASDSVKAASDERLKELQTRLDTLATEAEAERARVQQTIDSFETQFKSEQETRHSQFEESKKELDAKAEQVIEESKEAAAKSFGNEEERADKVIADLHERSSKVVNFLAEKKQEAIDMVDAEATSSTAGAFKKEAEEQKGEADLWRLFALALGGVALIVALVAVGLAIAEVAGGSSFLFAKLAAITLLLGVAGYAAGQSGQHRRREKRARRLYLELVAFKPFSEPLPEPERHAVRKEFIERLFVGDPAAEGEDHKEDDVKFSDENLSVLLKFMDMVRSR
jgi:hypothetical protein